MILITLSCFVFIITQVVPINADFLGSDYQSYLWFEKLGYVMASNEESQNISLNVPNIGTSSESSSVAVQYYNGYPYVTIWRELMTTVGFNITGSIGTDDSLLFPFMKNSGHNTVNTTVYSRKGGRYDYIGYSNAGSGGTVTYSPYLDGYTDFYVISFVANINTWFDISNSSIKTQLAYSSPFGNYYLKTYYLYTDSEGFASANISFSQSPSTLIPLYSGQFSNMSEEQKTMCGMGIYTDSYAQAISTQFDSDTNRLMYLVYERLGYMNTYLINIKDALVTGDNVSQDASSDLIDKSDSADSAIAGLEGAESDLIGDFNSNLVQPDTSFISQLSSTGQWVRNQFDRLVGLNGAFSGALVVGLTVALALVIVGKMRG